MPLAALSASTQAPLPRSLESGIVPITTSLRSRLTAGEEREPRRGQPTASLTCDVRVHQQARAVGQRRADSVESHSITAELEPCT